MIDKRTYARTPIDQPLEFRLKSGNARIAGIARDISVGGTFIETKDPAPFSAEVVLHITLPGDDREVALPGVVRWTRDNGMGVQFGLLGARETHLITEIERRASGT